MILRVIGIAAGIFNHTGHQECCVVLVVDVDV